MQLWTGPEVLSCGSDGIFSLFCFDNQVGVFCFMYVFYIHNEDWLLCMSNIQAYRGPA